MGYLYIVHILLWVVSNFSLRNLPILSKMSNLLSLKLLITSHYYHLHQMSIEAVINIIYFISENDNALFLLWLYLKFYQFYLFFLRNLLLFICFCLLSIHFLYHLFPLWLYNFLPSTYFLFFCSSFSSFLRQTLRWLILKISLFYKIRIRDINLFVIMMFLLFFSCVQLCDLYRLLPARLLCPRYFPGKKTGVGGHFLIQGTLSIPKFRLVVFSFSFGSNIFQLSF